jgi:hypothetical protein
MKKNWGRLVCIGICHIVLYMYLVPMVIYPRFGKQGTWIATIFIVVLSIAIFGNVWFGKKKKQ